MKIKKFRICNFRSIIDSGDCYPTDNITILAGKNEAGKSSILEALEQFSVDKLIKEEVKDIKGSSDPTVSVWFTVSKQDILSILETINFTTNAEIPEEVEICLEKEFPDYYTLLSDFLVKIGIDDKKDDFTDDIKEKYSQLSSSSIKEVGQRIGIPLPKLNLADLKSSLSTLNSFHISAQAHIGNWSTSDQTFLTTTLPELLSLLSKATAKEHTWEELFLDEFFKLVPNFILFNSFDDIFPNEILLTDLAKNSWISDLQEMSDLNIETITGENERAKISHKNHLNVKLNENFSQFWTQDVSRLSIDWNNQKLHFWIEEEGYYYEPAIRSQGRRWHLAFYIRISSRAKKTGNNIILIDEPGLYLHANAQRDILKNLENASAESQIIFSTHSPYLIEADKLDRIRLVRKLEKKGTVIENKLHSSGDKETLTPILTAIGLELNQGIVAANRVNNIVVEGPSDYFYLTALSLLLGFDNLNFVSGGSSGNMPKIGTILQGWGGKVIYLYDDDQAYKNATKNIKKEWLTITKEMLLKIPVQGAIEDMFTKNDFATLILEIDPTEIKTTNSEFIKGKDKVLASRKFLNKVKSGTITVDQETSLRAEKLLNNLKNEFVNYAY